MLRWPRLASLAAIVSLVVVGCTTRPEVIIATPESEPAPPPAAEVDLGGLALVAQPYNLFLFAPPELVANQVPAPRVNVQPGTVKLQEMMPKHERLEITPLPSTDDTVALGFQETAGESDRWGEVLTPALRKLFGHFAADPELGEWLIVVDDVIVLEGPDGVPLTAYRWHRGVVEAYAECGIPPSGIDHCTDQFYIDGQEVYLIRSGTNVGQ